MSLSKPPRGWWVLPASIGIPAILCGSLLVEEQLAISALIIASLGVAMIRIEDAERHYKRDLRAPSHQKEPVARPLVLFMSSVGPVALAWFIGGLFMFAGMFARMLAVGE